MKKSIVLLFGGQLSEDKIFVAASGRAYDLAKIIQKAGYKPIIIGFSTKDASVRKEENFSLYVIKRSFVTGLGKITNFFRLNRALKNALEEIFREDKVLCLFYQSAFTRLILPTFPVAKKHGVPLGVIANDWYEYTGNKLSYFDTETAWKLIYPRFSNFIVTSRYFERYFSKGRKNNILYVPSVFDEKIVAPDGGMEPLDDGIIRIAYAGNMGHKDRIDIAVCSLRELVKKQPGCRIQFHLYGSGKEDLQILLGDNSHILDELGNMLIFHGFIKREKLRQELQRMDFTILIRPYNRNAEAGFAGKFSESLLLGVPVIANLTGDMGNYLQDGKNGLVVEQDNASAVEAALKRALDLSYDERKRMRQAARQTGLQNFCLSGYTEGMRKFIENISSSNC